MRGWCAWQEYEEYDLLFAASDSNTANLGAFVLVALMQVRGLILIPEGSKKVAGGKARNERPPRTDENVNTPKVACRRYARGLAGPA